METGQKAGMCTFEGTVVEKYKLGLIHKDIARKYIRDQAVKAQLEAEISMRNE
jgi:Tfp pilus assembly pilus retraction ATPase PilT